MVLLLNNFPKPAPACRPPVELLIAVHHLLYGEMLRDPGTAAPTVEGLKPINHLNHLFLALDQKAGLTMLNQLRHRSTPVGEYRRSRRHRFDNDHPERFVPLQREKKPLSLAHYLHYIVISETLDVADHTSVNLRLHLFIEILLAPRQVSCDMTYDQKFGARLLGDANSLGNAFARRHPPHDHEEIFRLAVKSDLVQIYPVIDDGNRGIAQRLRLSVTDAYRKTVRKMFLVIFVELSFHICVSDQGRRGGRNGEIRGQSRVRVNHIEAF